MRVALLVLIGILAAGRPSLTAQDSANGPVGLAKYTLKQADFAWITRTSPHYRTHYLPGSAAERTIDSLVERNEAILARHLDILGEDEYARVIDLFYFDSREQIEAIVTKPFRALADARNMTVLAVRNADDVARDAHEIMHVVSFDLWGGWDRRDELAWLGEGLATHSDEPCNGHPMTELAAHILMHTEDVVPLDSLATSFRQYPEMIGYMLVASFVEYVVEQHGLDDLRRLWREGYAGIEEVLGMDPAAVEKDWHAYVKRAYPEPKVSDWSELRENGCR